MQACDIRFMVIQHPNDRTGIRFANMPVEHKHLEPKIAEAIMYTFLPVLRKNKIRVGNGIIYTTTDYIADIDRVSRNEYNLCFHTTDRESGLCDPTQ